MPARAVSVAGRLVGLLSGLRYVIFRAAWVGEMQDSLSRITGDASRLSLFGRTFRHFGYLGELTFESASHEQLFEAKHTRMVGAEHAVADGRQTIFVCAHVSNWELCLSFMVRLSVPGIILYWLPDNPVRRAIVEGLRLVVPRHVPGAVAVPAGPKAMRRITTGMSAGSNLLIFVDESKDGKIWGPSLGRDLPQRGNRVLAARLAVKYGARVVPVFVRRCGFARYECVLEPALEAPTGCDDAERARALAKAIDARVEHWVRAYPEQWFWLGELITPRGHVTEFPWKGDGA